MKRIRAVVSAVVAALTLLIGAGAASAQLLDHFTFHEESTDYFDCDNGLHLRMDTTTDGRVVVVSRDSDPWDYGMEVADIEYTVTNLATGETFTVTNKGLIGRDQTVIANPDGTTTLLANSPAQYVVWGPDGMMAFHGAGLAVYEFLITGDEWEYVGATFHGFNDVPPGTCNIAAAFWL